jgi:hypothetical protein
MENDTVTVANTNKTTLSRPLSESEYPPFWSILPDPRGTEDVMSTVKPLSESEYPPLWSILPDPRGTEDVMSKASACPKSSLKIVAVADEDEWWYYELTGREGPPGWADDCGYTSDSFDSFEKCYRSYIDFNPYKHWKHLRSHTAYIVYVKDGAERKNEVFNGMISYDNSEKDLGISEHHFDALISKIEKERK